MKKSEINKIIHAQINVNGHIIGVCSGSGITAKYASVGGADFILVMNAGRFRMMGRGSLASYLGYTSNNRDVMRLGTREILPNVDGTPVIFGLMCQDPFIDLFDYLKQIKANGFSGVTNFPTVTLIDGQFRQAIEKEGNSFDKEVEALRLANHLGLFTIAFITNLAEAEKMLDANVDVLCVHTGLTSGGDVGAKTKLAFTQVQRISDTIFRYAKSVDPEVVTMIYSSGAGSTSDLRKIYDQTECEGLIGGSSFDRLVIEKPLLNKVREFKEGRFIFQQSQNGETDFVEQCRQYIKHFYANQIKVSDLALMVHMSVGYLSRCFKKQVGLSIKDYLVQTRIERAKQLLQAGKLTCNEVGSQVGYYDYPHFSKIFTQKVGLSPHKFQQKMLKSDLSQD